MIVGIPKETRPFEYRVGLNPAGAEILSQHGHQVYVERDAGVGAGFKDREYESAGARIIYSGEEIFARADLVLKVARPLQSELDWLKPGAAIAGLLHLASARRDKVDALLEKKITSIAYEQIQLPDGSLPLLRPFSQIAGSMTAQVAARLLQNNWGGKGILLGGAPGVPPAEVLILGSGVVATHATQAFLGLGAHVSVMSDDLDGLQKFLDRFPGIVTMMSTKRNIERATTYADVVVGAALITGARTPVLVTREMVRAMKPRSVIIDVSIDQGGCFETSRPTTHDQPTFVDEGVMHYCVPNMPGVVARTATHAFVNAAMPYLIRMADDGIDAAIANDPALEKGVNTHRGGLVHLTLLEER
ncbi:MAG TPA: alanine dehydrogenase [Anaerolineales bacterium]|nr:alanine dehydrogenase [Anaerolineales bacterium]HMS00221.1 alanine dehydrogenase [Anaerolineales bacterium]HNQ93124.1 alanine dehydrogenase [Anaerolineales bacterium]HNS59429.1 alanine dehydrogenase [Anaerolineales bacterium]